MNNQDLALAAKGWPFVEARKLLARFEKCPSQKGCAVFETGYGPSGLPHIGTFGEVVRTTFVRHAFAQISTIPTRLICFSDDMDGLRKVPTNIPHQEEMAQHLGKPLTQVPDPFGLYESFAHHNNARLKAFLDSFGFDYTFYSSTACYQEGLFDAVLLKILEHYQEILQIILPTLRPQRQATYSPFLPLCPETGVVLQVPIHRVDPSAGTVVYQNDRGKWVETLVTGGKCKLQWKVDWALRWHCLEVDYEMAGKDLIDSVKISRQICSLLGRVPPENFIYELFLDAEHQKVSKSKGNGLTIEDWLAYAPQESLVYFMYQAPRRARRLAFDVIPRHVDDYFTWLEKFQQQSDTDKIDNAVWHVHQGVPPCLNLPLSFHMILNLVSACHGAEVSLVWSFITRYIPGACAETMPALDRLVIHAVRYYQDCVAPYKKYKAPSTLERAALMDLNSNLSVLIDLDPLGIQSVLYAVGKRHGFADNLKEWFASLYRLLLGQDEGPRMGSFIAFFGIKETQGLIQEALHRVE